MNCHEYRTLIDEALDASLEGCLRRNVALHIEHCSDCRRYLEATKSRHAALYRAMNRAFSEMCLSNGFADRLVTETSRNRPSRRRNGFLRRCARNWLKIAAGVVFAASCVAVAEWAGLLERPMPAEDVSMEAEQTVEDGRAASTECLNDGVRGTAADVRTLSEQTAETSNRKGEKNMNLKKTASVTLAATLMGMTPMSAAAALGPTTTHGYVSEGLVHCWDALDNQGTGASDPAATTWKDLAGDADLACVAGQYSWGENYFQCGVQANSTDGCARADRAIGDYQTVEIVFRGDGVGTPGRCIFSTGVKTRFCWLNGPHGCIQFSETQPSLPFTVTGNYDDIALAATYASSDATSVSSIFQNGQAVSTGTYTETWGQYPGVFTLGFGKSLSYCFSGRIYTIRMYSRALSAEELAANAAVDRVRFLGYESVDISHVWTGAAGTSSWMDIGNWSQPNGSPATTVPDATSGVSIPAGTGPITLPATDAEVALLLLTGDGSVCFARGALTAKTVEFGAALVVELGAGTDLFAKTLWRGGISVPRGVYTGVGEQGTRVAWLTGGGCCCIAGRKDKSFPRVCHGLSARDYVQTGLVHQWDGLENASSRIHDADLTVWRDLAGDADLTCTPGQYAWGESYFQCAVADDAHSTIGSARANRVIGDYRTVEVVFRGEGVGNPGRCIFSTGVKARFCWLNGPHGCVQFSETQPSLPFTMTGNTDDMVLTATYASSSATSVSGIFQNGQTTQTGTYTETWGQYPDAFALGFGRSKPYCFAGRIYAIRMYERELTADEVAANAALDRCRFFGEETATTHVWSGAAGSDAWGDARNWRTPSGDAVTAAPTSRVDCVSIVAPAGSSLAIRLPRDGVQVMNLAVEGPGSVTLTATPEFSRPWKLTALKTTRMALAAETSLGLGASVVLEAGGLARSASPVARGCYTGTGPRGAKVDWLADAGALNVGDGNGTAPCQIQEYTTANYVRDGLIAAWDGLENVGYGVHDKDTTIWKDLIGERDLTLGAAGSWGESWLTCSGGIAAQGSEACGNYQTIEIVYRCTYSDNNSNVQVVFDSGKKYRFVVHHVRNDAIQFASGPTAGRLTHDRALADIQTAATFNSTSSDVGPSDVFLFGQSDTTTYNETWSTLGVLTVGRCSNTTRLFLGRVYAIRLYDRVLSTREIAQNTAVDNVRFFGAEPPLRRSMTIFIR